ncbi:MAG TPA: phosphatidylglycerophosphatase A, partial [Planctomycetota bacterium]|nr:phosphatidylglycerophosphatase A [Planctomycetota bacterium]
MRKLLVTFFGLGYGPVAPGTWGSAGALAVYLALFFAMGGVPWWLLLVLIALACGVNLAFGRWAVAHFAGTDPKPVVIDEVAGMWLSLLFVPVGSGVHALVVCAAAFFLFRIFDILKLPPARQLERLPDGAGILCDDLAAGVQANVVLQVGLVVWAMLSSDVQGGITLGLVQGVTEFLPVSSSGHLALGRALLDNPMLKESPLLFDVAVHAATLLAIVVYFRVEVWRLIRGGVFT